jgi:hypothetical protein
MDNGYRLMATCYVKSTPSLFVFYFCFFFYPIMLQTTLKLYSKAVGRSGKENFKNGIVYKYSITSSMQQQQQ